MFCFRGFFVPWLVLEMISIVLLYLGAFILFICAIIIYESSSSAVSVSITPMYNLKKLSSIINLFPESKVIKKASISAHSQISSVHQLTVTYLQIDNWNNCNFLCIEVIWHDTIAGWEKIRNILFNALANKPLPREEPKIFYCFI